MLNHKTNKQDIFDPQQLLTDLMNGTNDSDVRSHTAKEGKIDQTDAYIYLSINRVHFEPCEKAILKLVALQPILLCL